MTDNATVTNKTVSDEVRGESTRGGQYFTPRVDIYETEEELTLFADVPGVRAEDVDLRFEQGELLLHARVQSEDRPEHLVLHEYETGDYQRVFHIHESIDPSKISAECKNGVLTVHLPKVDSIRPKQVKVCGE
ncbi:MAG: Hsp20/alpha crystallin family protein [Gemmataceae bacterium]